MMLSTRIFPITGRRMILAKYQVPRYYSSKDKSKEMALKDSNDVSEFKIKSKTSSSAPAPIDSSLGVEKLMKKDKRPYIPKLKHERLTFDYPGLPNEDDFIKQVNKPKKITRWSRYVPKILSVIAVIWGGYTIKVWYFSSEKGSDSKDMLSPNAFHPFIITHKQEIDKDHYLIEIHPKYNHWQYSYYNDYAKKSIWNGDKIWSVEVKQPEIMVVRSYTPLPLYFMKSEYTRSGEREPLLKVVNNDAEDYDKLGVMSFYIKKYDDGEVSKYIVNKKVGDEIEMRGPYTDYKFPYHPLKQFHERPIFRDLPSTIEPEHLIEKVKKVNKLPDFDNVNFYGAGTGIAPILQVLLSRNPYRGFVNVHYSAKKEGELKPLERFLFFLEKLDRIKLHSHYDTHTPLSSKDISKAEPSNYISDLRLEEKASNLTSEEALKLRMSVLEGDSKKDADSKEDEDSDLINERYPRFENAIQQAVVTSQTPKKPASLTLVCGPDGFVDYLAGPKDRAHDQQGPVLGLLKDKNWDNTNVFKF